MYIVRVVSCLGLLFSLWVGGWSASAATIVGSNFDGIASLIYDTSSGNVFLENGPLPNPAVQRLIVSSASSQLLPGNLTFPALVPLVTVSSNSSSLIDIEWSGGAFLGTGSSLGAILPASLPLAFLLGDLSIEWAPASQVLTGGDLLYGTFGNTQGNPVLPNGGRHGFFLFFDVASGQFMDPPWAVGFDYLMTSASLFTKIGFPLGYGSSFDVLVGGVVVAAGVPEGGAYTFAGPGVSAFGVRGISPAVDAAFGDAFPLYMEFSTPTASFEMTAFIPEPASFGLLAMAALVAVRRRR